jgi:hypothetical protein
MGARYLCQRCGERDISAIWQGRTTDTLKNPQKSSHIDLMQSNSQKHLILTNPALQERPQSSNFGVGTILSRRGTMLTLSFA